MYKNFKRAVYIVALAVSLTACGERLEKNISTTTLHDGTMSCADIQREFFANKRQINDIIVERSKSNNKNVALMDVKSSESNKIPALDNRNAVLNDLARMKRCKQEGFDLPAPEPNNYFGL
ncbi:hypothetical protein [Bartonella tribocorum]|uniref:Lipoprotein n=1 Tax=Bartonella tribocorum TaxID=85701 RepID=A0A2M6URJ4_9HYPH|nr:hypothetical protein [Bartonella tribocorum]PIT68754.1 hypothetical protein CER18_06075 [Bartonella tribocorum]